jgi:hypothetical protein
MTAPAAARTPSPADLARRPAPAKPAPAAERRQRQTSARAEEPRQQRRRQPYVRRDLTLEQAIAPGVLEKYEHFRPYYRHGMILSRMPAPARLVGHDLMWRAHHASGRIQADQQPDAEAIADSTGLPTAQVLVAIEVLRTRGWLIERTLRSGATAFDLVIPAGLLEDIRVLRNRHA